MAKSLGGSSQSQPKRSPKRELTSSSGERKELTETQKSIIVGSLLTGKSRRSVAEKYGMSEAEIFRVEEEYYSSLDTLSEHAALMKQIHRLDKLLDRAFDMLDYVSEETGPSAINAALQVISEISALIGLKKNRIEAEVKLIQPQQVQAIISFNDFVVGQVLSKVTPLLTDEGRLELEGNKDLWITQAVEEGVDIIDAPTAKVTF